MVCSCSCDSIKTAHITFATSVFVLRSWSICCFVYTFRCPVLFPCKSCVYVFVFTGILCNGTCNIIKSGWCQLYIVASAITFCKYCRIINLCIKVDCTCFLIKNCFGNFTDVCFFSTQCLSVDFNGSDVFDVIFCFVYSVSIRINFYQLIVLNGKLNFCFVST